MKKYFLFFILLCNSYLIFAKFSDDISDGDFSNNPIMIGDFIRFEILSYDGFINHHKKVFVL